MFTNRYNNLEEVLRITTNDHMKKYVPLSINMNNTKRKPMVQEKKVLRITTNDHMEKSMAYRMIYHA